MTFPDVVGRLYEHLFVHVPSGTRMHVLHYLAGILHYVLAVAAVLAEAPGFVLDGEHTVSCLWRIHSFILSFGDTMGLLWFCWGQ